MKRALVVLAACGGARAARPVGPDPQMIAIPAGRAVLGSTPEERAASYELFRAQAGKDVARKNGWFENEEPRHEVDVAAFTIDRTPVTNAAYAEYVAAGGAPAPTMDAARWKAQGFDQRWETEVARFVWTDGRPPPGREDHPVVLVTWDEAAAYCAWRGRRLPTAVEMERAARGPDGATYPWGATFDPQRLVSRADGTDDTAPVGSRPAGASGFGVLDLAGEVYEWTSTPWPPGTDAARASAMTVKGSAWDDFAGLGRGAQRHGRPRSIRHAIVGFRCAGDVRGAST